MGSNKALHYLQIIVISENNYNTLDCVTESSVTGLLKITLFVLSRCLVIYDLHWDYDYNKEHLITVEVGDWYIFIGMLLTVEAGIRLLVHVYWDAM